MRVEGGEWLRAGSRVRGVGGEEFERHAVLDAVRDEESVGEVVSDGELIVVEDLE